MQTQTLEQEIIFPDLTQVMASAEMQLRMDEAEERVRIEKLAKAQDAQNAKKDPKGAEQQGAVSPRNGQPVPAGPGRTPGVKNRLTNLREAVLEAFELVGGAQYLAKLAQGTSSDRAAFVSLVSKVLPTQINADVSGGIQVQLSWLGARGIGQTHTVDLERQVNGRYAIADSELQTITRESSIDATCEADGGQTAHNSTHNGGADDAGSGQADKGAGAAHGV
jgi:hypothetical protein